MKINSSVFPLFILFAGTLFSGYLLGQIPEGVYFSGDGGLKALLAEQLAKGQLRFDLVPPSQEWIQQLWQNGLYPYQPPFVYHLDGYYYISFPFPFSLVTAPFYALFGYWGLYIIPLISTWAIWWLVYWGSQRLQFSSWGTSFTLLVLIFGSNLTLYGAMYWEHTLAVALCFAGLFILLIFGNSSPLLVGLSGFFIGLSPWFRSEFFGMIGLLFFLTVAPNLLKRVFPQLKNLNDVNLAGEYIGIFWRIMGGTVALFFLANQLIYHRFLGVHALLVTEGFSLARRLAEAWHSLKEIIVKFFEYFPIAFFPLLYLLIFITYQLAQKWKLNSLISAVIVSFFSSSFYLVIQQNNNLKISIIQSLILFCILSVILYLSKDIKLELTSQMVIIYLICLGFTIAVSLLVDIGKDEIAVGGKQWGQRYLLILIPLLSLIIVPQLNEIRKKSNKFNYHFYVALISALCLIGIYKNMILGDQFFSKNYQGVKPAIEALKNSADQVVAVSHQYASQMLEPSLKGEKVFFLASQSQDLIQLSEALLKQNQARFIYVCYPYRQCYPTLDPPEKLTFAQGKDTFEIRLSNLGKFGKYPLYQASIINLVNPKLRT